MRRGKKFLYNTFLLTGGSLFMRITQMAFQVYLSGKIGAAGIGLFQLIMIAAMLAATVGTSGIRVAATCIAAEEYGKHSYDGVRRAMNCCFLYAGVLSLLSGFLLYWFSEDIAVSFISDERAALSLKILAFMMPIFCLTSAVSGYFTAFGKIGRYVALEVLERIIGIGAAAVLLHMYGDLGADFACASVIGGTAIGSVFYFVLIFILYGLDQRHWPKGRSGKPMMRRVLSLAVPNAFNEYVQHGLSAVSNMLIPWGLRQWGSSKEKALASYGTIHGMAMPVLMFPSAILLSVTELIVPELAESRAMKKKVKIRFVVSQILKIGFLFSLGSSIVMFCMAEEFGLLIYDSYEAAFFIRVLSPLLPVLYLDNLVEGMNKGLNRHVQCMRNNMAVSVLTVVLLFILTPKFGIYGFLAGFALTKTLGFFLGAVLLIQASGCTPSIGFVAKSILCGAACFFASNWFHNMTDGAIDISHIFMHAGVILGTYVIFLMVFRVFRRGELHWLLNFLKP